MKIALIGSTGLVGKNVLTAAIKKKIKVKALTRDKKKLNKYKIQIVEGNSKDNTSIEKLLKGVDVVINTIGPSSKNDIDIHQKTINLVIKSMNKYKIKRYIGVTGLGVKLDTEKLSFMGKFLRFGAKMMFGKLIDDKRKEHEMLKKSKLDWTLILCPLISETACKGLVSNQKTPTSFRINVSSLATFVLNQIYDKRFIKKGVFVSSI